MAIQWDAKAPGEVAEREWAVPVPEGDSVTSYTATISGATKDSDSREADTILVKVSAGTDGATATVTLTATTAQGLVFNETAYLPIRATPLVLSNTVRDVCNFALRPIVGLGATPTADELADAQEHLDDMLAEWSETGADLGVKLPTTASDTLYVPDAALSAIKHNLRVRLSETYGQPVTQQTYMAAMRGIQQVKMALLPDERDGVEYY